MSEKPKKTSAMEGSGIMVTGHLKMKWSASTESIEKVTQPGVQTRARDLMEEIGDDFLVPPSEDDIAAFQRVIDAKASSVNVYPAIQPGTPAPDLFSNTVTTGGRQEEAAPALRLPPVEPALAPSQERSTIQSSEAVAPAVSPPTPKIDLSTLKLGNARVDEVPTLPDDAIMPIQRSSHNKIALAIAMLSVAGAATFAAHKFNNSQDSSMSAGNQSMVSMIPPSALIPKPESQSMAELGNFSNEPTIPESAPAPEVTPVPNQNIEIAEMDMNTVDTPQAVIVSFAARFNEDLNKWIYESDAQCPNGKRPKVGKRLSSKENYTVLYCDENQYLLCDNDVQEGTKGKDQANVAAHPKIGGVNHCMTENQL